MTRCPLQIKRERRLRDLQNEADIEQDICDVTLWLIEVVLLFRPSCSPFKVDQGFTLGC